MHTVAEVDGTEREGEAWFTADEEARSIRWGSQGESHYGGELEVTGAQTGSQVDGPAAHRARRRPGHQRRAGRDPGPHQAQRRGRRRPGRPRPSPDQPSPADAPRRQRVSRRSGCSGGTSTSTIRVPSGSVIHISASPHGSRRGSRTTWAASSRCAAARSRTCSQSATRRPPARRTNRTAPGSRRPGRTPCRRGTRGRSPAPVRPGRTPRCVACPPAAAGPGRQDLHRPPPDDGRLLVAPRCRWVGATVRRLEAE